MKIKLLEPCFSVCRIADMGAADWNAPFCFAARTDEEYSLVCPDAYIPANALTCESGWRAMRIEGVLNFDLVGILARISGVLAQNGIPIFAVSTYNSDYILVKEINVAAALDALAGNDFEIE